MMESLSVLSIAAEAYEETVLGLKPFKEPDTLAEIVELKLFENKIIWRHHCEQWLVLHRQLRRYHGLCRNHRWFAVLEQQDDCNQWNWLPRSQSYCGRSGYSIHMADW